MLQDIQGVPGVWYPGDLTKRPIQDGYGLSSGALLCTPGSVRRRQATDVPTAMKKVKGEFALFFLVVIYMAFRLILLKSATFREHQPKTVLPCFFSLILVCAALLLEWTGRVLWLIKPNPSTALSTIKR